MTDLNESMIEMLAALRLELPTAVYDDVRRRVYELVGSHEGLKHQLAESDRKLIMAESECVALELRIADWRAASGLGEEAKPSDLRNFVQQLTSQCLMERLAKADTELADARLMLRAAASLDAEGEPLWDVSLSQDGRSWFWIRTAGGWHSVPRSSFCRPGQSVLAMGRQATVHSESADFVWVTFEGRAEPEPVPVCDIEPVGGWLAGRTTPEINDEVREAMLADLGSPQ